MARYTPEFLAAARHGYENTDQPMRELARELGIGITTLSTLAENNGWAKRSQRKRGLRPEMRLLEEARALVGASSPLPPRSGGEGRRAPTGASRGGGPAHGDLEEPPTPDPSPPLATLVEGGEQSTLAPVETAPPTLLDRMEQILEQLIVAEETAPANGIRSPQSARNLATLIQAMRALKRMRGGAPTDTGPIDNDDDMPKDIDEFRRDLARRIDAFVASRTDAADADGDCGRKPLDEVR